MRILRTAALAVWALLAATVADAQSLIRQQPFYQIGNTVALSTSNASSNVQLGWVGVVPSGGAPTTVWVCNTGSTNAYVLLGVDNTVVATTSTGTLIVNGNCNTLWTNIPNGPATYIAGITTSSSTTLAIMSGNGSPQAKNQHHNSVPTNNNLTADDGSTNLTADDGISILTAF